jgi:integrase
MGSITERNGILQFNFRCNGQRFRESAHLEATTRNRKHCDKKLAQIEKEIANNVFNYSAHFPSGSQSYRLTSIQNSKKLVNNNEDSFHKFAELWFLEKQIEWRQSYKDTVRISLDKYILPYFGALRPSDITKPDILAFRMFLSEQPGKGGNITLSPSRINHIMTPLRMTLNEAADRYGFTSPWQNIKSLKEGRTQVQPFTFPEVKRLIRSIRADYRPYLTVRFFTGMRTGEINGLKWQYVDFDRRQILVREAWVQGRQVPTKTDGSIREIEMSSLVYDALTAQKKKTFDKSEYVFASTESHQPISNSNFIKRIWYPLLERLKLEARRPYQIRHTAATLWLASGESPEWIARQMGHTTTEMLFRVYSRYVPNLTRQDGSAFERLLSSRFKRPLEIHTQ